MTTRSVNTKPPNHHTPDYTEIQNHKCCCYHTETVAFGTLQHPQGAYPAFRRER